MKTSIILTHWAQNEFRSRLMRECVQSIVSTAPEAECIVIDNGGNASDSTYLLEHCERKNIACYIRNRHNMSFAFGYNQGEKIATGDYLVFTSNDIVFENGWLEECIGFLETHQGKYLATPLAIDRLHDCQRYQRGAVDGWTLNAAAGSNVFVVRKKDFQIIGEFENKALAGTKWMQRYSKMGYVMACMPVPKAKDMAFKEGFRNIPKHAYQTTL